MLAMLVLKTLKSVLDYVFWEDERSQKDIAGDDEYGLRRTVRREDGRFKLGQSDLQLDFKSMDIDKHMLKNGKTKKVYVFKLLN